MSTFDREHYKTHPSGVECIEITEHLNFCLGNAMKYIWRAGVKSDDPTEDLGKAIWYLNREIERVKRNANNRNQTSDHKPIGPVDGITTPSVDAPRTVDAATDAVFVDVPMRRRERPTIEQLEQFAATAREKYKARALGTEQLNLVNSLQRPESAPHGIDCFG